MSLLFKYKWFPNFSETSKHWNIFQNLNGRNDLAIFDWPHIKINILVYMWYPTFLFCAFIIVYATLILNGFQIWTVNCPDINCNLNQLLFMVEAVYAKHTLGTVVIRNMIIYYHLRPFPCFLSKIFSNKTTYCSKWREWPNLKFFPFLCLYIFNQMDYTNSLCV